MVTILQPIFDLIVSISERIRLTPFDTSSPEGRSRERHRRIALTSLSNLLVKGVSLAVNLIVVRLVFQELGKDEFGLWAAITSIVLWSSLLDFGVLNGLTNAVSEAYGKGERQAVADYVSTAFYYLVLVTALAAAVVLIVIGHVAWSSLFAATGVASENLVRLSVLAALAPIVAGFPLSVVRQVYAGLQKSYVGNLFTLLGSGLTLLATLSATILGGGLPALVLALGIGPLVAALTNYIYLVRHEMPWIRPRLAQVTGKAMRRLLQSSVPLFMFQVGGLLVNNTQPFLLARLTDLSTVADYSMLIRLAGLLGGVVILTTQPFVPAFREAYERGDRAWVVTNFRRMLAVRVFMTIAIGLVLVLLGNFVLRIWLGGPDVSFGTGTWAMLSAILVFTIWGSSFTDILTIMDRIWVLVGFVMLNGLCTIGLTLVLIPRYPVMGALIAYGFASVAFWSWSGPILARSYLWQDGQALVVHEAGETEGIWWHS